MKSKLLCILSVLMIVSMLALPSSAWAQGQPPVKPTTPPVYHGGSNAQAPDRAQSITQPEDDPELLAMGLEKDKNGKWFNNGSLKASDEKVSAESVLKNEFGYTATKTAYAWTEASDSGQYLDFSDTSIQWIQLPYDFPFFEHTYTAGSWIGVVRYGYLSFQDSVWVDSQLKFPTVEQPTNLIAPYWAPIDPNYGGVYMLNGGTAPNRWTVIEWQYAAGNYPYDNNQYTFEVVLYENGDIEFQYDQMYNEWGWYCGEAGIEDKTGTVATVTSKFCYPTRSYTGYKFTYPTPMARVGLFPLHYGGFASLTAPAVIPVAVENTGRLGPDTYDLALRSGWKGELYDEDGTTLLTDTDGDKKIDTGPIPAGEIKTVYVKIYPPTKGAAIGKSSTGSLTFTSSLDTHKKKTASLGVTIPASFTQVYEGSPYQGEWGSHLMNVTPDGQQDQFADGYYGPRVAKSTSGNKFVATYYYDTPGAETEEIFFSVYDRQGNLLQGATKVEDLSAVTQDTYDFYPAMASAPGGSMGMAFLKELYDANNGTSNYNIYFTLLSETGQMLTAPVNLTLNTGYMDGWSQSSAPRFMNVNIAALSNGHFVVSYQTYVYNNDVNQNNVGFMIIDDQGNIISQQMLTNDDIYEVDYSNPTVLALTNDRFMVAWGDVVRKPYRDWYKFSYHLNYTVYDLNGNLVKPVTTVTTKGTGNGMDAAQLSTGQIILTWTDMIWPKYKVYYMVLNDGTYKKAKGPVALADAAGALTGNGWASITADDQGRAVVTWMDGNNTFARHTYYDLLGKNGAILTKPVIFATAFEDEQLYTDPGFSSTGY